MFVRILYALSGAETFNPQSPHTYVSSSSPCPFLAEAVTALILTVQAATTAFLLSYVPPSRVDLMEWTLLPMIGATIASGGAFCLNTQLEVRKIVIGRCLFALTLGVLFPRLLSMAHPWILELLADPLIKVGAGFVSGFISYVLSWPAVKSSYLRAQPISDRLIKTAEEALASKLDNK